MKEITIGSVSVNKVVVGENFRKAMDKTALKELTENVRQFGVIEPIITRMVDGDIMLVAGARRLAAAQEAGLKTIPCRQMDLTEIEAQTVQAIENLHRENLNPIDEAEQFDKMLQFDKVKQAAGVSHKELAALVNKTVKYIYRSLALLNLPKEVKDMIKKGTIKPAHGHLLLRVPEGRMDKALEYINGEIKYRGDISTQTLAHFIDKTYTRDLKEAIFDKTQCATCPTCSKNQSMLFDNVAENTCDNAVCFRQKTDQHRKDIAEKAKNAPSTKEMKYLGVKQGSSDYSSGLVTVGNGVVLTDKMKKIPAIKKALETDKSKFGFIVNRHDNKTNIVITDEALLKAVGQKAKEEQPKTDWDKERFVGGRVRTALAKAFAEQKGGPSLQEMVLELMNNTRINDFVCMAFTGKEEPTDKDLAKLAVEKLVKMWYTDTLIDQGSNNNGLDEVLKDAKAIAKKEKASAEADYPAEKARKEAVEKAAMEKNAKIAAKPLPKKEGKGEEVDESPMDDEQPF